MSFSTVNHSKWIEKIKKELKKEELSGFNVAITPSISIDPFFGRKPKAAKGNRLEKDWKNKQVYYSSTLDNTILLEDLVGGINTVEIYVDTPRNNWKKLLEEVILEYIQLTFIITDQAGLVKEELVEQLNLVVKNPVIKDRSIIFQSNEVEFVEQLTDHFKAIVALLDQSPSIEERNSLFDTLRIDRKISAKMISELTISDAINIISRNICKGFSMEERCVKMHAFCEVEANETLERNYIDLGSKALNAALASYDAICIAPAAEERASFHHRISRNIHHLLKEEAVLHQSRSAYSGAYQVNEITNVICHKIWKEISR